MKNEHVLHLNAASGRTAWGCLVGLPDVLVISTLHSRVGPKGCDSDCPELGLCEMGVFKDSPGGHFAHLAVLTTYIFK